MRDRCVDLLAPSIEFSRNPVVVDATLGLGGHTEALLARFPELIVIGIDRDPSALSQARARLSVFRSSPGSGHHDCVSAADPGRWRALAAAHGDGRAPRL